MRTRRSRTGRPPSDPGLSPAPAPCPGSPPLEPVFCPGSRAEPRCSAPAPCPGSQSSGPVSSPGSRAEPRCHLAPARCPGSPPSGPMSSPGSRAAPRCPLAPAPCPVSPPSGPMSSPGSRAEPRCPLAPAPCPGSPPSGPVSSPRSRAEARWSPDSGPDPLRPALAPCPGCRRWRKIRSPSPRTPATRASTSSSLGARQVLRGRRGAIHVLADAIGALLQFQRRRTGLGQGLRADLRRELGQLEDLLKLFALTSPADSNLADAARVVLELLRVRLGLAGLGHDQNVVEAAKRDAGLLAHLVHLATVGPEDRGGPPLGVAGGVELGHRSHHDPRSRFVQSMDPGRGPDHPPVEVFLGVLPEGPDGAVLVLSVERELRLVQLAFLVVLDPDHDSAHAIEELGQISDDGDQTMGDALSLLGGRPFVDPSHSRLQREPRVVDRGRTLEVVAVEVLELLFGSIGLLCHRDAAGQHETTRREQDRHEDRRDAERSRTRSAEFHCHHVPSLSVNEIKG